MIARTTQANAAAEAARKELEKLQGENAEAKKALEDSHQANMAEIQQLRTKLDVDASAQRKRAEANDKRAAELDAREKKIAEQEATLARKAAAIREHAKAVAQI